MIIYCMSDIHGHLKEFEAALSLIDLSGDNKLVLLGDYIHGGPDSYGVLDKIISLQEEFGSDKCITLMGNHEEMAVEGRTSIVSYETEDSREGDAEYINWMNKLRLYYKAGNTIFVHAGIEEEAEDLWEHGTPENVFYEKFPPTTGTFYENLKIVAGHAATSSIADNPAFHDIYYDGESHYFIDGTVKASGAIPVLKVNTDTDKYYRVTESGDWFILPYDEEY